MQAGSPGHAVLVLDVAKTANGETCFLIGQSYMPAQQFHVLQNPEDRRVSPWYRLNPAMPSKTPESRFPTGALRRLDADRERSVFVRR
jgi:hypothetical protein